MKISFFLKKIVSMGKKCGMMNVEENRKEKCKIL